MFNLFKVGVLMAGLSGSFFTVNKIDEQALETRPPVAISRRALCSALLEQPDWQELWISQSDLTFKSARAGLPMAREFRGPARDLDAETAELLAAAEGHSTRRNTLVGEAAIRRVLGQIQRPSPAESAPRETLPNLVADWQTFKDYQASRFAIEIDGLDRILDDYRAGLNLDVTAIAVSEFNSPTTLARFAADQTVAAWFPTKNKRAYFWHRLAWDPVRRAPVWSAGWSEM